MTDHGVLKVGAREERDKCREEGEGVDQSGIDDDLQEGPQLGFCQPVGSPCLAVDIPDP